MEHSIFQNKMIKTLYSSDWEEGRVYMRFVFTDGSDVVLDFDGRYWPECEPDLDLNVVNKESVKYLSRYVLKELRLMSEAEFTELEKKEADEVAKREVERAKKVLQKYGK